MNQPTKHSQDKFTREDDKRFTLRIDKKLFSIIEAYAKINKRAIGREIEFVLESHYKELAEKSKSENYKAIRDFLSSGITDEE